ncbi:MFS transporter [Prosthecobacter vanneervenii]|uniref:MFS family permease n=1 Tax=Prosthecobacter vanneervenii TaxID=48466 RepID=A0A7W7Y7J9_9BACT|nr:MFS transporter [Prosthecobacter vanneervenii]MBB5031088.1 MFS family permease [Prosthecobacter vanneervenii]
MPQHSNASLFVWFRILFNCRFYYPVFTILFLDLGLSIGEFAALNVVWALTSVVLEVPSGALADRYGRRPLVVAAGILMVLEMAVLCLMQPGHHDLVLWLFVANRVLSGAAEACASGADEALAYDSLPEAERSTLWPQIMARLSRGMALGFVVSSIVGSVLYDPHSVAAMLRFMGLNADVAKTTTMKLPLLLCLGTAALCLVVTLRMTEARTPTPKMPMLQSMREAWGSILQTGGWMWRTRAAFALIVFGLVFDSMIRLFLTVASNFYRLVGIEEGWYGVIGTGVSLLGLVTAGWMETSARVMNVRQNFLWLGLVVLGGLLAAAHPQPGWAGVALVVPLFLSMRFLQFFLSHYLNEIVDSAQRATALSFRGLTINLAYGTLTLLFGWQTGWVGGRLHLSADDPRVFAESLKLWPWWFAGTVVLAGGWVLLRSFSTAKDEHSGGESRH